MKHYLFYQKSVKQILSLSKKGPLNQKFLSIYIIIIFESCMFFKSHLSVCKIIVLIYIIVSVCVKTEGVSSSIQGEKIIFNLNCNG